METLIVSTAFLLGLAGSLHCFGMCGPIAFAIIIDRDHRLKMILQNLTYQSGRIIAYTALGMFFGLIGYGFFLAGFQKILSFLLGISMMASVFLSRKFLSKLRPFKPYTLVLAQLRFALSKFIRKKTFPALFITGILNGLLPCGLVYTAITTAMSTGEAPSGGLFMLYFGLGTVPLMFVTVMMGNFISLHLRNKILRIIPFMIFFVGILLVLRSLGLGIPYVSPRDGVLHSKEQHQEESHKKKTISSDHCH
ncbi:MAG: sulfite exporter TauE/SafE family protein [Flavobacteriales bacterium AspAUS03]